jgi:prepilin-type processing-associated H-X9-DG protein
MRLNRISRLALAIVLAVFCSPVFCRAQALADRVPGDAMLYIGWNGIDSMGPGYDGSHLKAMMEASEFQKFLSESIPSLLKNIAQQDAQTGQMLQQILGASGPLWHHPTALYFGGVDFDNQVCKAALLCDAGDDAASLTQQVDALLKQVPPGQIKLKAIGHLVVISSFDFPDKPDKTLSQNADFTAMMGKLGPQPVLALYVDGVAANALADQAVAKSGDPDAVANWPKIRDMLGITGLKHIGWTSGFSGKDWSDQIFVDAPGPRTGLLKMLDGAPLGGDLIKLIPATATQAGAGTCDLGALVQNILSGARQISPDVSQQIDQGLGQIDQMLGFDLQSQLFNLFGPEWAFYSDPSTAGSGGLGLTLMNRPRDPAQLETSLTKLEQVANQIIKQQLEQNNITIEFRQTTINGATVHYLALPMVSPAWTIKDGTWYFALYPQVLSPALNRPANAKSILDNPAFGDVRRRLAGPDAVSSFSFIDLPKVAPEGYQGWLMISQVYMGLGDLFGLNAPPMFFPPLEKIMPELDASGSIAWSDDGGFHMKSMVPFPGAELLGAGSNLAAYSVGEEGLMVSILLPSLNRARETANRVKDASNLRQIGQGILLYSNDAKGKYPPDLGTLYKTEDFTPEVFLSPFGSTAVPAQLSKDQLADWVNQNSDYVYIAAGMNQGIDPSIAVAYEKPGLDSGGSNVLYGDGHVDFVAAADLDAIIQKSKAAIQAAQPHL